MDKSKKIQTTIVNIKYPADDIMEITFKINGKRIYFTPGQFIDVEISEKENVVRAYSVLRYDIDKNEISIAVKKVPNGLGTTIIFNKFKVGMNINISNAKGKDLIVDKDSEELLLVATGIGITPIYCVLEDLIKSKFKGKTTFVYGIRHEKELHYFNEIKNLLTNKNLNIDMIPVVSNQESYKGHKGYVTDIIKDMNLNSKKIYLCSSKIVENALIELLTKKNFDLKKFFCESA